MSIYAASDDMYSTMNACTCDCLSSHHDGVGVLVSLAAVRYDVYAEMDGRVCKDCVPGRIKLCGRHHEVEERGFVHCRTHTRHVADCMVYLSCMTASTNT